MLETFAERIAIVGTRNNTAYGKEIAESFGADLAAAGLTVVSGAARGIDTFAHSGALKKGRTVAVLGCGINAKQTVAAKKLLEEISEGGLVLSEFEPNFPASQITFPMRNRIIAGLCRGVIVVEAGEKSGALITTSFAADFGRDVFAVPGSIYWEQSLGCHNLIRDGAILITSAQDVLDFYEVAPVREEKIPQPVQAAKKISNSSPIELDETEKKVFNLIPFNESVTVDEILMQTDELEPNEISEILLKLEIKKIIRENDGTYTRTT